jgi:hypothetical protein
VIDLGTYFISEWPFLAPEQPSLLLRPPTGFAPKRKLMESPRRGRVGWKCVIPDFPACDAHALKAVNYCPNHDAKPGQFQRYRW